jgi:hypothetical protein
VYNRSLKVGDKNSGVPKICTRTEANSPCCILATIFFACRNSRTDDTVFNKARFFEILTVIPHSQRCSSSMAIQIKLVFTVTIKQPAVLRRGQRCSLYFCKMSEVAKNDKDVKGHSHFAFSCAGQPAPDELENSPSHRVRSSSDERPGIRRGKTELRTKENTSRRRWLTLFLCRPSCATLPSGTGRILIRSCIVRDCWRVQSDVGGVCPREKGTPTHPAHTFVNRSRACWARVFLRGGLRTT